MECGQSTILLLLCLISAGVCANQKSTSQLQSEVNAAELELAKIRTAVNATLQQCQAELSLRRGECDAGLQLVRQQYGMQSGGITAAPTESETLNPDREITWKEFMQPSPAVKPDKDEKSFLIGNTQYIVKSNLKTLPGVSWQQARQICRKKGMYLIALDNEGEDSKFLLEFLKDYSGDQHMYHLSFWLAAFRRLGQVTEWDYLNTDFQPSHAEVTRYEAMQHCVHWMTYARPAGIILQQDCNLRLPYICEKRIR